MRSLWRRFMAWLNEDEAFHERTSGAIPPPPLPAPCGHSQYWRTNYGGCMACQRDQAAARASYLEERLADALRAKENA